MTEKIYTGGFFVMTALYFPLSPRWRTQYNAMFDVAFYSAIVLGSASKRLVQGVSSANKQSNRFKQILYPSSSIMLPHQVNGFEARQGLPPQSARRQ